MVGKCKLQIKAPTAWPCGKCMPCRIRRREKWVLRMCLELASNNDARFVTYTYEECRNELVYEHMQAMHKRLLEAIPGSFRFVCVGEYGSLTLRPHWHAIYYSRTVLPSRLLFEKAWRGGSWTEGYRAGFVDVDARPVTSSTCRYVAKYITKDERVDGVNVVGRSRMPAIGSVEIERLALDYASQGYSVVPAYILYGGKKYFLDQTMKRYFGVGISKAGRVPVPASSIMDDDMIANRLYLQIKAGVARGDAFYRRLFKNGQAEKDSLSSRAAFKPRIAL